MKIRSGFVSNSSSSSFVVVAPKAIVEEVLNTLRPYERAVAEHVRGGTKNFMGQEVNVFQGMTGNYDSWEYAFEYEGGDSDADDNTFVAWTTFMEKLREKCGDNILVATTDC